MPSVARRLFLGAQGLLADPARPVPLREIVGELGFVQVDSINVVARAHDLTLAARSDGYLPTQLDALLAERALFEHWTHDASIIPTEWYAHWKPRFRRDAVRLREQAWWRSLLGPEADSVVRHVRRRIAREGPLRSADFETAEPRRAGGWWSWKPHKAALDYLWRTGELAVRERVGFQKVYDLTERVLPEHHRARAPTPRAHREWACSTAAERLVVFTPRELRAFWSSVTLADAAAWCTEAVREGRLEPVGDGAFALHDWRARADALPDAPQRIRLLSPFDPILRDRARALRRFGFDYRFEAFTPSAKRVHGYYVLPILDGDALVGRLDPKLDRDAGVLHVRGPWWQPGITATKQRRARLDAAIERLARFVGATRTRRVSAAP